MYTLIAPRIVRKPTSVSVITARSTAPAATNSSSIWTREPSPRHTDDPNAALITARSTATAARRMPQRTSHGRASADVRPTAALAEDTTTMSTAVQPL